MGKCAGMQESVHTHPQCIEHRTRFFFARKYAKLRVFCWQVEVFPSAALLPMTHLITGARLVWQRLQLSFWFEPSREDKNTHPPRADKILERTRRSRRSPPGEDTTKPSWRWLNLARRCHRLFHSTDPSRLCLGDGQKESAFKGIFHVKSVNFIM